jgi:type I restriction enzyme M protein
MPDQLTVRREKGKIWSHVRQTWLYETPEESVRQEFLCILVNEYGFALEQIGEEVSAPGERGTKDARADFVIWRTVEDRRGGKTALIVVECKADNVAINQKVYVQGANYAQYERAKFFVTHNRRNTKFWKVDLEKRAPNYSEIKDIPHASDSDTQIKELLSKLKPFEGKEFADLLHACHNVIRNNEHLDPAAAFDEIAKILFVKVWVERRLKERRERKNLFTVDTLKEAAKFSKNPIQSLFDETKEAYRFDNIFKRDERINLRPATVESIVGKLASYNLSETSEDVKGIAFERFLGGTFRGEIGQFFSPRPIVEFMIRMVEPKEGDIICDPASGSGGFLIRFFEIVREAIAADIDAKYKAFCAEVDAKRIPAVEKAKRKRKKYEELQAELDPVSDPDAPAWKRERSRIWKLANLCIYGTDANDRMARTSKMNMIMHGDGHGGVHHHNGLLNVNGIFERRFKIVLTNPPFGATVSEENVVLPTDYTVPAEAQSRYRGEYGSAYDEAVARVEAAEGKPILSLFTLPETGQIKTELLFMERCLDLLEPGGRLGIVLPEGVFNNTNDLNVRVREFVEDRARLDAMVSLAPDTFKSSGADVKASLLFLTKFTDKERKTYDDIRAKALKEIEAKYAPEIARETARLKTAIEAVKATKEKDKLGEFRKQLLQFERTMAERIAAEGRALLKDRFSYPVFLYEAERVGINATGDPDENQLYPNDRQPVGCAKTCLELYREFKKDPKPFFVFAPVK